MMIEIQGSFNLTRALQVSSPTIKKAHFSLKEIVANFLVEANRNSLS